MRWCERWLKLSSNHARFAAEKSMGQPQCSVTTERKLLLLDCYVKNVEPVSSSGQLLRMSRSPKLGMRGTGELTMDDQMQLFDTSEKQSSNNTGKAKRKWENGFQRWSNRHSADGDSSFGCCGFGSMCDYCDDNSYGRPCVRALNAMIREKRLKIDYEKTGYVEAWEGILDNG